MTCPATGYGATQCTCPGGVHRSPEPRTEWTTKELQEDFKVLGFSLGYAVVERKADGVVGSLEFERRNRPDGIAERIYHSWRADQ